MASSFRMLAVHCADIFARSTLQVMITYLTDVLGISLTHAASIINIFVGARDMLLVGMVFLADAFLGFHHMFLISAILTCVGMSLLSLSSLLSIYKEVLYYTALPLLAIGFAGHAASYQRYLDQIDTQDLWENIKMELRKIIGPIIGCDFGHLIKSYEFLSVATILLAHVGGFLIQFVNSWAIRFGISTIFVIVATVLYLTRIGSYTKGIPKGSPLTTFCRVLVASFSKKSEALPVDANELYQENGVPTTMPHTNRLRCLDKAAIILPNSSLEKQKCNKWKLCSVTEVEEAKVLLYVITLCMSFTICGVVTSIGDTYFVEQGEEMNPYLGELMLPVFTLLLFCKLGEEIFSWMCGEVRDKVHKSRTKYVAPIGMVVAMLCSILCCVTAAAIEKERLKVFNYGSSPMTMFWLIPQYLFLSAHNGIYSYSSTLFIDDQIPESLKSYLVHITKGITGVGTIGGVITVYAVGKISEIGRGKSNWFQDTLNNSRLDKYYWSLAVLCSINLVFYVVLAMKFPYRNTEKPPLEPPEEKNPVIENTNVNMENLENADDESVETVFDESTQLMSEATQGKGNTFEEVLIVPESIVPNEDPAHNEDPPAEVDLLGSQHVEVSIDDTISGINMGTPISVENLNSFPEVVQNDLKVLSALWANQKNASTSKEDKQNNDNDANEGFAVVKPKKKYHLRLNREPNSRFA